jgi:photosystem II stability/assembly factor-like uncharacterized protein
VSISEDGGTTWDEVFATDDLTYMIASDPAQPARLLLAAGSGIWRSDDAGDTWSLRSAEEPHAAWVSFDPTSGGQVAWAAGVSYDPDFNGFAGGEIPPFTPGLYRTTDGGTTWSDTLAVPAEEDVGGVAVSADGATVAAASIGSGPYVRTESGPWRHGTQGITQSAIQGVAPVGAHLVGGAHYEGVVVSEDGGATWDAVPTEDAMMSLVASPARPERLLAANWNRIYKSEDGGRTWSVGWGEFGDSTTASYLQPGTIAFHPTDPDTWYVLRGNTGEVTITHDNGGSFTDAATGLGSVSCAIPIAPDPEAPDTILVGDACGAGIVRSENGGTTWTPSTAGLLDGHVLSIAFGPGATVLAGTLHRGVFRSEDGGRTWSPSRRGLGFHHVKDLLVDPLDPLRVLAAVDQRGIYASVDGGHTWYPAMEGLTSTSPVDLAADADGSVYVSTDGGGILRLTS